MSESERSEDYESCESESDSSSSEDEGPTREENLRVLENYHQHFPEVLKKGKGKGARSDISVWDKYAGWSDEKVERELAAVKAEVSGSNAIADVSSILVTGSLLAQDAGGWFGLELNGPKASLAESVQKNQGRFGTVMKEIMCKHDLGGFMEPEARLAILFGSTVIGVHSMNTNALREAEKEKAAVEKKDEPLQRGGDVGPSVQQ